MSLFARSKDASPDHWKRSLEAAFRVSEIGASGVALPAAVQQVVTTARELFGADESSVMLLDPSGRELILMAASGLPPEIRPGYRLPMGESVAGRVIATGRSLLLGEVDSKSFVNFVPKTRRIGSSLVAPLRVEGRAIGVLSLSASDKGVFSENDRRMAQLFADQAAALIHRTKLHEQAERRSSDLTALMEATHPLLGNIDLESLIQAILDGAGRLTATRDGLVCLYDSETGSVSQGVFRGLERPLIQKLTREAFHDETVAKGGVVGMDVDGKPFVAVGLRSSQGTRGLVALAADIGEMGASQHLLQAFAQQCATALGSAELHWLVQRKESELSSIIQSVPMPLILVDSSQRFVSLNPPAEQLFGIDAALSQGRPVAGALDHPEIARGLAGDGPLSGETKLGDPPRSFRYRVVDVRIPGAPMGRLLVMDDVTVQRDLAQTQQDFMAMIGHELRTPLTVIKGFTRMMIKKGSSLSVDESQEALATIDSKTGHLEHLIEDLLYVSGIESREATLRVEEVGLRGLIEDAAGELLETYPDREVTIEVPTDLRWTCDASKVALITRHLIDNALKYSAAPEPVVVRALMNEGALQVDVVDRGVGLVSSDIPVIFDRFRQLDGSATRERGGAGVGLYVCSRLVKLHEGRIWVDSIWGKGSTFSFSLPQRRSPGDVVNLKGTKVDDLSA